MWHEKLGKDNFEVFLHPFDQRLYLYFRIFIWYCFGFFSLPVIFFVLLMIWGFDDILIFMEKILVTNPGYQPQHIKWAAAVKVRKHLFSFKKIADLKTWERGKDALSRSAPIQIIIDLHRRQSWVRVFQYKYFCFLQGKYFWQTETWLGNGQSYKFPD